MKALLMLLSGCGLSAMAVGIALHNGPEYMAIAALIAGGVLMFGSLFIVARSEP